MSQAMKKVIPVTRIQKVEVHLLILPDLILKKTTPKNLSLPEELLNLQDNSNNKKTTATRKLLKPNSSKNKINPTRKVKKKNKKEKKRKNPKKMKRKKKRKKTKRKNKLRITVIKRIKK